MRTPWPRSWRNPSPKARELRLSDEKGRQIIIPANVLGYVEIGAEEVRRVGFGAL